MRTHLEVEHVSLEIKSTFTEFTYRLEKALGVLNPSLLASLEGMPASLVSFLHDDGDEESLVLFNILEFDELLRIKGHLHKVKQYQIGNAAMTIKMTKHQPAAGLYMPLRLLVYENQEGKIFAEYDLPSTLFVQSDAIIHEAAVSLDNKLINLIESAEKDAIAFANQ